MDPIQILNIDGLGPVNANVNTTQYGSIDGEYYSGSNVGKRNIVLTIGLNADWVNQTIADLRRILYSYFIPTTQVKLRFTSTHMAQVEIIGYVETCEPSIFSRDTEMQVSIICPQPYFKAVSPTETSGQTAALTDSSTVEIVYEGDIAAGFVLDVFSSGTDPVLSDGDEVRVLSNTPSPQLLSVTVPGVDSTKQFRLSTVEGDKFIQSVPIPEDVATSLLGKLAPGSVWIKLQKGSNQVQVTASRAYLEWSMSYNALYGGL